MKRNGMCPICFVKNALFGAKTVAPVPEVPEYDSVSRRTPLMGWSSWNTVIFGHFGDGCNRLCAEEGVSQKTYRTHTVSFHNSPRLIILAKACSKNKTKVK